jgi:hypothetical protein
MPTVVCYLQNLGKNTFIVMANMPAASTALYFDNSYVNADGF